jgi:hypothetical protein
MPRSDGCALLASVALVAACNEPYSFQLEVVDQSGPVGAVVLFDGDVAPDGVFRRVFDSYDEAEREPALVVEVMADGVKLDIQPVEFEECLSACERQNGSGCGLSELVESQLLMAVRSDGQLSEVSGSCNDGDMTFVFTP